MKVYYAHPISLYDSLQEERDLDTLRWLGFEPVNPNTLAFDAAYEERGMDAFKDTIKECDALAFRAFHDGSIPAGVAKELGWANEFGLIVFELPSAILRRSLTVDETRAAIRECGHR